MKKPVGLSQMMPARYAIGGRTNDQLTKPAFNPAATFTGSPAGTGLESSNGGFTAATANAAKGMKAPNVNPVTAVGSAVQPTSFEDARYNTLSAFLGGPIKQETPAPTNDELGGTPMPKWPVTAPAPVTTPPPISTTPDGSEIVGYGAKPAASNPNAFKAATVAPPAGVVPQVAPGLSSLAMTEGLPEKSKPYVVKYTPEASVPFTVDETPKTVAGLDATQDTTKYGLSTGQTVGYGGKLNADIAGAYKREFGRAPDAAGQDYWRTRLAGGMGLSDIEKEFNASAEGKEFNLTKDPLDDEQFATKAYRTVFGRDPDEAGKAWLTNMLNQGYSRADALKMLAGSDEFKASGKTLDQGAVDALVAQGDPFKVELKNDETETIAGSQFKAVMGRDPSDFELAKYADAIRTGRLTLAPGDRSLEAAIKARKAAGWAEGGRVTSRDRFIDEQASDKKETPRHEAVESPRAEKKEDRAELDDADRAYLAKHKRKSLGERVVSGLSSLIR